MVGQRPAALGKADPRQDRTMITRTVRRYSSLVWKRVDTNTLPLPVQRMEMEERMKGMNGWRRHDSLRFPVGSNVTHHQRLQLDIVIWKTRNAAAST